MATLEKIRSKAGLLVAVVGVALFAFIIGDFLNSGSTYFRQSQETVAVVDGEVVKIHDYQLKVDEMTEMYKMQTGQSTLQEEYMTQIRQSVFDGFVQDVVMKEATEDLGMEVSSDELYDMVQGENISPMIQQMPMFQNQETGAFDKFALLNFLKAITDENMSSYPAEQQAELLKAKSFWMFWETTLKRQRLQEKYTTLLSKAINANKLDAEDAFNASAKSADISYAMQSYASIPDSTINVSDSDIKKLYEQRKEAYKRPESRRVKYIAVDINPSQEDYDKASKEAEAIKEELSSETRIADVVNENSDVPYIDAFFAASAFDAELKQFATAATLGAVEGPIFENDTYRLFKLVDKTVAPDSVKVSHIMLAGLEEDRTKQLADSLQKVLKGGADFAELAKTFSADQQAAQNGGELGWFTEVAALRGLNEDFKNAIFAANLNDIVEVKSQYGTHLVKITEKTKAVDKYKVANVAFTVSPSSKTYSNIYNELNQYLSKNSDTDKMDETAKEAGYSVMPATTVSVNDQLLGGVPSSRQVVRWVFQNATNKFSEIFECEDKFVVAVNLEEQPAGYRSVNEVAAGLRAELAAKAKGEKIAADLTAKNLTSIESYAEAMGTTASSVKFVNFSTHRIAGIGMEPNLNAMVSLASKGQVSAPVKGTNGVYVFSVIEEHNDGKTFNMEEQVNALNATNAYRFGYQAVQALTSKADIEDYRVRFY